MDFLKNKDVEISAFILYCLSARSNWQQSATLRLIVKSVFKDLSTEQAIELAKLFPWGEFLPGYYEADLKDF